MLIKIQFQQTIGGNTVLQQGLLFNRLSPLKIFIYIFRNRKCPNCGSVLVGNGEGHFELTERHFVRKCKCGSSVIGASMFSKEPIK
ncbi:DUF3797 domain-containing protein [Lysinibacillus sphaericus]|uniref:DUF3797 domain-containing protein n=1 Tax=Lysinibacillus sphaericus TaxID=1421 RepID=UPI003F7903E2